MQTTDEVYDAYMGSPLYYSLRTLNCNTRYITMYCLLCTTMYYGWPLRVRTKKLAWKLICAPGRAIFYHPITTRPRTDI